MIALPGVRTGAVEAFPHPLEGFAAVYPTLGVVDGERADGYYFSAVLAIPRSYSDCLTGTLELLDAKTLKNGIAILTYRSASA